MRVATEGPEDTYFLSNRLTYRTVWRLRPPAGQPVCSDARLAREESPVVGLGGFDWLCLNP